MNLMVLHLVWMYVMFLGHMACRWSEIISTYDLPQNYGLQVKKRFIDILDAAWDLASPP
jgi:hypothetical protein